MRACAPFPFARGAGLASVGSGMAGIDGLNAGDPVTAEQMRALFGGGMHPLAEQRIQQLGGPDLTEADLLAVMRLGTILPRSDMKPWSRRTSL